jgi:hypothetical protein
VERGILPVLYHFVIAVWRIKRQNPGACGTGSTIAEKLSKSGWSLGWVSAVDSEGRTIWIVDAHRSDTKRFVVRAEEKLTTLVELESVISGLR